MKIRGNSIKFICVVIASNLASLVVTFLAIAYAWKTQGGKGSSTSSIPAMSGASSSNVGHRLMQECRACSDSLGLFKGVSGEAVLLDSSSPQYKVYQ
jgi:hypothetical protein